MHSHNGTGKPHGRQTTRTLSGAVAAKNQAQGPSNDESAEALNEPGNEVLDRLIAAWPSLSDKAREQIIAILDAAEQLEASR